MEMANVVFLFISFKSVIIYVITQLLKSLRKTLTETSEIVVDHYHELFNSAQLKFYICHSHEYLVIFLLKPNVLPTLSW